MILAESFMPPVLALNANFVKTPLAAVALRPLPMPTDHCVMDVQKRLGQYVRRRRKALGMTLEELAAASGNDTTGLSRLERGMQAFAIDRLRRVCDVLGLKMSELFADTDGESQNDSVVIPAKNIPVLTWDEVAAQDRHGSASPSKMKILSAIVAADYAIVLNSDVMEPELMRGATLLVQQTAQAKPGDFVIAQIDPSAPATVRRLMEEAGTRYLIAANPRYPTLPFSGSTRILGVIVGEQRTFR